jgi:uncharacterized membrane protein
VQTSYAATRAAPLHPLHSILLAFAFPLFLGALVSDYAYSSTFEIQWSNFSSWLIAGALLMSGFATLWALISWLRARRYAPRRQAVYVLALIAMWVLGFINALVHAKDAWAVMPEGLYLSIIVTLLALVATWLGYSGFQPRKG